MEFQWFILLVVILYLVDAVRSALKGGEAPPVRQSTGGRGARPLGRPSSGTPGRLPGGPGTPEGLPTPIPGHLVVSSMAGEPDGGDHPAGEGRRPRREPGQYQDRHPQPKAKVAVTVPDRGRAGSLPGVGDPAAGVVWQAVLGPPRALDPWRPRTRRD